MASRSLTQRQESRGMHNRGQNYLPWPTDRFLRIFDQLWNDIWPTPWKILGRQGENLPRMDISDKEKEIIVKAELPGMDERDIEVSLSRDRLTLRGERRENSEEKGKNFHRHECFSGTIYREVELPEEIDVDKSHAEFNNGILTLTLPKNEDEHKEMKKIPIHASVKGGKSHER